MSTWYKIFIPFLLLALLFTASCSTSGPSGERVTTTPDITEVPTQITGSQDVTSPEMTGTVKPKELQPLQFYSINEATQEKEARTALISSHDVITPDYVLSLVVNAMDEIGMSVKIDSIKAETDTVHISFSKDSVLFTDIDGELEIEILDAFAQSVLDNFTEYSKVVFQIEGKAYITANNQFDEEYVYLERK